MKSRLFGVLCGCAFVCQGVNTAESATITYTNETAFLAAAGITILEDFESYTIPLQETPISTTYFDVSTTPILGGTSSFLRIDAGAVGEYHPIDGTRTLAAGSISLDPFMLSFDLATPTTFVGFWVTDFGDGGAGNLSFTNDAGDSFVIASSPLTSGNELFFGVINDTSSFTSFSLVKTTTDDGFGVDRIFLSQVPVPPALYLFGSGLIGLIGVARRKTA